MNDTESKSQIIDAYVNIKRVKNAADRDKEIERQEAILKAKLQVTVQNPLLIAGRFLRFQQKQPSMPGRH